MANHGLQGAIGKSCHQCSVHTEPLFLSRIGEAHAQNICIACHERAWADLNRALVIGATLADDDDPAAAGERVEIVAEIDVR